jgi:hypothetical protein
MKKALVLSLLVLSLGVAAYGGTFTGSWDTNFCVSWTTAGAVTFGPFESMLYVDYTVCDWTFGSNAYFGLGGLSSLWFDASGSLGAFSFAGIIEFSPADAAFVDAELVGQVSIAGVDFYALFAMSNLVYDDQDPYTWGLQPGTGVGVGAAYGLIADVGDCTFGAEINFGAGDHIYWAYFYGVLGWYGNYDGYQFCDFATVFTTGGFADNDLTCDLLFTGLSAMVEFPFTCLDVVAIADFSCTNGFEQICFLIRGLDIGVSWFDIDSLSICYFPAVGEQTSGKTVCIDFDLTLGDAICVTPYFDIVMDGTYVVDGIELTALLLTYNYNGVTFKAGEIFNHGWERESEYLNAWNYCSQSNEMWYFTPCGDLTRREGYGCAFRWWDGVTMAPHPYAGIIAGAPDVPVYIYPNEMFGVTIDGDSCCGGAFDVCLFNFFVADTTAKYGIFGWLGSYASVTLDIGTQTYIGASLTISFEEIESFCFKFGFSW